MDPSSMLYDALIPSLEEVGARFERGDYFVPEMLIAARAMQGALDILRPLLAETGAQQIGTFVMGTVKGDVHDIGKNLVNIMLEGAGFTVIDLGVNVAPEKFVEPIEEHKPDDRRLLGVPHDDDADVQGEHQRAREGRPARQGDRHGRRRARDPGVRRRGRRRRLRGRRLDRGAPRQGPDREAPRRSCPREAARPHRERGQGPGLRLPDVRPVRPALDRHDVPDELPEDAAQRALRRRARERPLRGQARDALRLGEGGTSAPRTCRCCPRLAATRSTTCARRSTTGCRARRRGATSRRGRDRRTPAG